MSIDWARATLTPRRKKREFKPREKGAVEAARIRPQSSFAYHPVDVRGTTPMGQIRAERRALDRWVDPAHGYAYVRLPGPDGTRGSVMAEHRFVMEEKLGRELVKGESVHHINGIRDDNREENLELWVGPIRYGQRARDIVCPHCGKTYA